MASNCATLIARVKRQWTRLIPHLLNGIKRVGCTRDESYDCCAENDAPNRKGRHPTRLQRLGGDHGDEFDRRPPLFRLALLFLFLMPFMVLFVTLSMTLLCPQRRRFRDVFWVVHHKQDKWDATGHEISCYA
jgi:hypothetical protein